MNGSKLAKLEVSFPNSLATQQRIVARLETAYSKLSELHRLQAETDTALASFTSALLANAFRGEL